MAIEGERDEWLIFDMRRRRRIGRGAGSTWSTANCALRADAAYFAVSTDEGVVVTDVKKESVLGTLPLGKDVRRSRVYFLGEDKVAAISEDTLRVWKLPEGTPLCSIPIGDSWAREAVNFTPGGRYAISMNTPSTFSVNGVNFHDTTTGEIVTSIPLSGILNDHDVVTAVTRDGRELALMNRRGAGIFIFDLESGELTETVYVKQSLGLISFSSMEWFPDGERFLLNKGVVIQRTTGAIEYAFPKEGRWHGPAMVAGSNSLIAYDSEPRTRGGGILTMDSNQYQLVASTMESGGSVNDAGLPPLTRVDRSQVRNADPIPGDSRLAAAGRPHHRSGRSHQKCDQYSQPRRIA